MDRQSIADRYVPLLSTWEAQMRGKASENAPSPRRGSLYKAVETVTGGCTVYRLHTPQKPALARDCG